MKVLAFGAREWWQEDVIFRVFSKLPPGTILIHGAAKGADRIAGAVGAQLGFEVREYPVLPHEWTQYGRAAGTDRNQKMLDMEHPDSNGVRIDKAFGFSTGRHNKGTSDMADRLWEARIRFEIFFPRGGT